MARTAMLTARVYPELKKRAETLFRSYGLSTSFVINAFLSECVRTGEIPLELARNITHLKVTRSEYESYKHMDQATEEEMILLDPEEIIILDIVDDEDDKDAENEQESADAKDESAAPPPTTGTRRSRKTPKAQPRGEVTPPAAEAVPGASAADGS